MAPDERYLEIFLEEADELVRKLDRRLLELERAPGDGDALRSALRLAHTLKGSARMVGLVEVSELGHRLETELKTAAEGAGFTPDAVSRLLARVDELRGRLGEAAPCRGQTPRAAPAADVPGPPAGEKGPEAGGRIRVSTERLEALQNLVDDLAIQKARLVERVERLRRAVAAAGQLPWEDPEGPPCAGEHPRRVMRMLSSKGLALFFDDINRLDQLTSELQDHVLDLRMVPVGDILEGYRRTVRDLARELGKEVEVEVDGKLTEVDRALLDAIQSPLAHLVRNAVDHGIEAPAVRERAGKPRAGRLSLRAYHRGGAVVLEVEDDGKGLDPERIRRRAVEKRLLTPEAAEALPDEETFYLLCEPGFTTRDRVSQVSGRGMGLDVVKTRVERLKGSLSIQSARGRFTRFRLFLPLSVSTLSALVVRVGALRYALPSLFVDRCELADGTELAERDGLWPVGDRMLPVVSLAWALGGEGRLPECRVGLVTLRFRNRQMVIQVDRLEDEMELVVKPLGPHLAGVRFVSGISFLSTGETVPVINVVDLYSRWRDLETRRRFRPQAPEVPRRVLVVDDSVTTRHMEENLLRQMGLETRSASNGAEAWRLLQAERVDLVVTDVDMPGMDGLELARRIRASAALAGLPVVVVSNRATDADQEAARAAGVDAYLTKDRFRQKDFARTVLGLLAPGGAGGEPPA